MEVRVLSPRQMGWHVPRHGETALQAICEEFDSLSVHKKGIKCVVTPGRRLPLHSLEDSLSWS